MFSFIAINAGYQKRLGSAKGRSCQGLGPINLAEDRNLFRGELGSSKFWALLEAKGYQRVRDLKSPDLPETVTFLRSRCLKVRNCQLLNFSQADIFPKVQELSEAGGCQGVIGVEGQTCQRQKLPRTGSCQRSREVLEIESFQSLRFTRKQKRLNLPDARNCRGMFLPEPYNIQRRVTAKVIEGRILSEDALNTNSARGRDLLVCFYVGMKLPKTGSYQKPEACRTGCSYD
ncbi:hypothetical protein J6590_009468 [Homalodisca vitripennis]|nr:hypothetical protein J6590_009468 [Homalodisca vitripennis]